MIDLEMAGGRSPGPAFALLGAVQVTLIATITVITVALPAIRRDLRLDDSGLVLVAAAYGVSFGGLLLLGGRLADGFGHRRIFVLGVAVFGLASLAAALAPTSGALLAARLAQGAGGALTGPSAMALVGDLFPDPRRRGRAMSLWGVLSSGGATIGTVLSGVVVTWVSWRWLFLAPVLISVLVIAAAPRLLPAGPAPDRRPIDWTGAALATGGLIALIYGIQRSAWTAVAGLVLLAAFGVVEQRCAAPLMPLAFLRRRIRPLLAVAVSAASMATGFYLLSLYLQQVRGLSPLETSAVFLLPAPAILASGILAARLIHRLGSRTVLILGLVTAAVGLLLVSLLGIPYAGLLVFPFGTGLAFSAATLEAVRDVPGHQAGLAAGLLNTAMETGPSLGLAALTALAAHHSRNAALGDALALRVAAVAVLIIALIAAWGTASTTRGSTEQ